VDLEQGSYLEHQHPLGKVAALRGFQCGAFEVSGSTEVINNLFLILLQMGIRKKGSVDGVIDFRMESWSILPTGQSGNPFSAHYSDQAALYNAGKFRRMLLNKEMSC
jgi:penicillin amidase